MCEDTDEYGPRLADGDNEWGHHPAAWGEPLTTQGRVPTPTVGPLLGIGSRGGEGLQVRNRPRSSIRAPGMQTGCRGVVRAEGGVTGGGLAH